MASLADLKFRSLSLDDLGLSYLNKSVSDEANPAVLADKSVLAADDHVLLGTRRAIEMGYAGIILSGPPGTGKSWYAQQVAVELTRDWSAIRAVQFHPSYQYEDFVFGYAPSQSGGFLVKPKEFVLACRDAAERPNSPFVLIIDELSRSDVVRVFGEALTYLEADKRDRVFSTASGEELSIPKNLLIIGTMNPWDKGVDELDMALERRFAQIDIAPSAPVLQNLLRINGASELCIEKVSAFFVHLQNLDNEHVRIGHAYFASCINLAAIKDTWRFRLKPTFEKACRLDRNSYAEIVRLWDELVNDEGLNAQGGKA